MPKGDFGIRASGLKPDSEGTPDHVADRPGQEGPGSLGPLEHPGTPRRRGRRQAAAADKQQIGAIRHPAQAPQLLLVHEGVQRRALPRFQAEIPELFAVHHVLDHDSHRHAGLVPGTQNRVLGQRGRFRKPENQGIPRLRGQLLSQRPVEADAARRGSRPASHSFEEGLLLVHGRPTQRCPSQSALPERQPEHLPPKRLLGRHSPKTRRASLDLNLVRARRAVLFGGHTPEHQRPCSGLTDTAPDQVGRGSRRTRRRGGTRLLHSLDQVGPEQSIPRVQGQFHSTQARLRPVLEAFPHRIPHHQRADQRRAPDRRAEHHAEMRPPVVRQRPADHPQPGHPAPPSRSCPSLNVRTRPISRASSAE